MEELEEIANVSAISKTRFSGYFCSDTVYNLSRRVSTEREIKILKKGLDYAPIQNKFNEPEHKQDFEDFCHKMHLKWHFRNEPTPEFSTMPAFNPKSTWKPPNSSPRLELFLSQVEKDLFEMSKTTLGYSNFSKEEWQSLRSSADDRNIVIKKSDEGSYVMVWDRNDYIAEGGKQLNNKSVYKHVTFKEKILQDLTETSNNIFKSLGGKAKITEKQLRPVISNCGSPTEKVLEFLDSHLRGIMQEGWSYIKDTNDFIKNMKNLKDIPQDALLVTADVVGLNPSIPH